MKILNVPIESLEERYSAQWNTWFPSVFSNLGVDFETICGDTLTEKISTGSFLDVYSTNYFKFSQLGKIIKLAYEKKLTKDTIVFFHDLWFPGLEALQYVRQGAGLKFKLGGILHAGTYDPYDFLSKRGMGSWGEHLENSWFEFVDFVFVATEFHKELLIKNRRINPKKIFITGLPLYKSQLPDFSYVEKENIVVFPHRLDSEKNPQLFDKLGNDLKRKYPQWSFLKTKQETTTKEEYYKLLAKSKVAVSYADQETWGIAQQEAFFYDCIPIGPRRLSYVELYPDCLLFGDYGESVALVEQVMDDWDSWSRSKSVTTGREFLILRGEQAILNIVRVLREVI